MDFERAGGRAGPREVQNPNLALPLPSKGARLRTSGYA